MAICKGFDLIVTNHPFRLQIGFRSDEENGGVFRTESDDFLEPIGDITEALGISDVETDHHTVCTTIKG